MDILFFGAEEISLTTAIKGVNGTHIVKKRAAMPYSGILAGEFVDPSELPYITQELVKSVKGGGTVCIAVPACFIKVSVKSEIKEFEKPQKITRKDTDALLNDGSAVYFKIDGGKPIMNANGHTAQKTLQAFSSHIKVLQDFTTPLKTCGAFMRAYKNVEYVPTTLAEANYLVPTEIRDKTCVLISCGMFTTSISVVTGDQLVATETCFMGTAHLLNDVSLMLRKPYLHAKELITNFRDEPGTVHEIIGARVGDIGEQLFAYINNIDRGLFIRPFYICGGHIDAISGARERLEKSLKVKISQLKCPFNETNAPDQVSRDAVISYCLN
jgi:hypothetical protein